MSTVGAPVAERVDLLRTDACGRADRLVLVPLVRRAAHTPMQLLQQSDLLTQVALLMHNRIARSLYKDGEQQIH